MLSVHKSRKAYFKTKYELKFRGQNQVIALLNRVMPYLIVKKQEAELLLQFCSSRVNRRGIKSGYTQDEIAMVSKMKELKDRRRVFYQNEVYPIAR